jgi:hypothetical protein
MGSPDIVMVVSEVDCSGQHDCYVEGRHLLSSGQPFLDGARVLLARGYEPMRRLVMRRPDREQVDLAAPLGVAVGLRVTSTPPGRPAFARYYGREETYATRSLVRSRGRVAA